MTATTPPTLTPARKGLIRRAFARYPDGNIEPIRYLRTLPSFAGMRAGQIIEWSHALGVIRVPPCAPKSIEQKAPAQPRQTRKHAEPPVEQNTQAVDVPTDEQASGEWYAVAKIAEGLGIGVALIEAWQHFGWLPSTALLSAPCCARCGRIQPLSDLMADEALYEQVRRARPDARCVPLVCADRHSC